MSSGTIDHKCPNCTAVLKFNPQGQNWKCEFCKGVFNKKEIVAFEKQRGNEKLTKESIPNKLEQENGMDVYYCPNCGAQIVADENTSATFCVYCKNTAILRNKLIGDFNPSKIIPFKKTKEDAIETFKKYGKGKFFLPKIFTSINSLEEITGLYVPFWLYDYKVNGSIDAEGKNIIHWSSGNYEYTKTDIYAVERAGTILFSKIPVDGSLRLDNAVMNSVEPYDYTSLEDFNYSFLSGFFAEKYDVDSNTANVDGEKRAYNTTTNVLRDTVHSYTSLRIKNTNHKSQMVKCEYALLPVWFLNVKYKDKIYTLVMNGQTGKMVGNIPIDYKKLCVFFVLMFISNIIILSIAWYFLGG